MLKESPGQFRIIYPAEQRPDAGQQEREHAQPFPRPEYRQWVIEQNPDTGTDEPQQQKNRCVFGFAETKQRQYEQDSVIEKVQPLQRSQHERQNADGGGGSCNGMLLHTLR